MSDSADGSTRKAAVPVEEHKADIARDRLTFELDEATADMVSKVARLGGVTMEDFVARAIANEAFIMTELANGRRFQLLDRGKVAPVNFA